MVNLEVGNNTYEFSASMKLKMMYDKDVQAFVLKKLKQSERNYTTKEMEDLQVFIEDVEKGKITEKDILENEDMQNKLATHLELINEIDTFEINYKYVFKMLNEKYGLKEDQYEKWLQEVANDYGEEEVTTIIYGICNAVFTKAVENKTQAKKSLPSWIMKK